jgi:hypothetical protein
MNILYSHEAPETDCYDTRIVVERLCDGSTDITIIVGECGNPAAFINHNLSIAESDKIGAAICKDIIDNYTRHAARLKDKITDLENAARDMRNSNNNLLNENTALRIARISSDDKRDEYRKTIVAERIDHMAEKRAINQTHHNTHRRNDYTIEELGDRIVELENMMTDMQYNNIELQHENADLEHEVGNLRVIIAIHHRRGEIHRNKIHRLHETHTTDLATVEKLTKTNSALKHDLCEQQERWDRFVIR